MLILELDYMVDLIEEGRVDEENESINLTSPSLFQSLEAFLQENIISATIPLDSPACIVVEVDDPFADSAFLGQMRCLRIVLTQHEEEWISML